MCVAFDNLGSDVAYGTYPHYMTSVVRTYNSNTGSEIRSLMSDRGVTCLAGAYNQRVLIVVLGPDHSGRLGTCMALDMPSLRQRWQIRLPGICKALAISPNDRYVAVAGYWPHRQVAFDRLSDGRSVFALPGDPIGTYSIDFSPSGDNVAIAGESGAISIWSSRTRRLVKRIRADSGTVRRVTFSPSGRYLCAAGSDGKIRFWTVRTGKLVLTLCALELLDGQPVYPDYSVSLPFLTSPRFDFKEWIAYKPDGGYEKSSGIESDGTISQGRIFRAYTLPIRRAQTALLERLLRDN